MAVTGGVGIIFGVSSVRDNKNLHILIQTAGCPKAVPLVTFDLIKSFPNGNAPAFQLRMNKGQSVDQYGNIIAGIPVAPAFFILIDNLQPVVMNILFIDELNVFGRSVIPAQHFDMVGLYGTTFFRNTFVGVGKGFRKEPLPFVIAKGVIVQQFQLPS